MSQIGMICMVLRDFYWRLARVRVPSVKCEELKHFSRFKMRLHFYPKADGYIGYSSVVTWCTPYIYCLVSHSSLTWLWMYMTHGVKHGFSTWALFKNPQTSEKPPSHCTRSKTACWFSPWESLCCIDFDQTVESHQFSLAIWYQI